MMRKMKKKSVKTKIEILKGNEISIGAYFPNKKEKEYKKSLLDYPNNYIKYERHKIQKLFDENEDKIPSIIEDLLNVGLATFEADLSNKRYKGFREKSNEIEYFSRNIDLIVPVTNVELWNGCKELLEEMISFLTYDTFRYTFQKKKGNLIEFKSKVKSEVHDSIILFSGGIDSLAGALSTNCKKPILLNINHCKIGKTAQKLFDGIIKNANSGVERELVKINIQATATKKDREETQFSRSFLYLCFATALAKAYGINKICIPENGVIAIQILDKGRVGTRTVHPKFLTYYNRFLNKLITNNQIIVENPFMDENKYFTKSDVVSIILKKKMDNLIGDTISCSHFSSFNSTNQCGMCIPCIYRNISTIFNNIQDDRKNIIDAFKNIDFLDPNLEDSLNKSNSLDPKLNKNIKKTKSYFQDAVANILEIINLTYELKHLTQKQLIIKYPELEDERIYNMYQNFADEVIKTIEHYKITNPSLEDIYLKLIPEKP